MAIEIGDFVPVCAFGSELAAAKQRWIGSSTWLSFRAKVLIRIGNLFNVTSGITNSYNQIKHEYVRQCLQLCLGQPQENVCFQSAVGWTSFSK